MIFVGSCSRMQHDIHVEVQMMNERGHKAWGISSGVTVDHAIERLEKHMEENGYGGDWAMNEWKASEGA